jgi:iron complex transport system substrate-binding protein
VSRAVVTALAAVALVVALAVVPGGAAAQTAQCSFPVSATDATGTEVVVEADPQRVVALQPSAAQTLWAIGAEEDVVGMPVNRYTAYLNGSADRTDVTGGQSRVVQPAVVALDPDLVLAPNVTDPATVERLRDAGETVFHFEKAESIADIHEKTELTGRLVGEFEDAAERTAETRVTVEAVDDAVDGREPPTVYYALGGGYTAGSETFIHELITTAGGENVAAGEFSGYQVLSQEILAQADPDWIVVPTGASLPRNSALNGTTAVREGQILRVDANYTNQAGPRTVVPLRRMAEAFHPDADVAAAVRTAQPSAPTQCVGAAGPASVDAQSTAATAAAETPGTATPDGSTATPGAAGPGFGPVDALLALLGTTAALARAQNASRR